MVRQNGAAASFETVSKQHQINPCKRNDIVLCVLQVTVPVEKTLDRQQGWIVTGARSADDTHA
jgi:hypothetical protein